MGLPQIDRKTFIFGWKTPENGSIKQKFQAETDRRRPEIRTFRPDVWTLRAPRAGPRPRERPTPRRRKRSASASFFRRASREEVEEQAVERMEVIAVAARVRGGGGGQQAAWMR